MAEMVMHLSLSLPPFMLLLSTLPPPSPTDLSEMLAEGTKESHDRAENCQFVKDFLRGRIKRELFKVGACILHCCYPCSSDARENGCMWDGELTPSRCKFRIKNL